MSSIFAHNISAATNQGILADLESETLSSAAEHGEMFLRNPIYGFSRDQIYQPFEPDLTFDQSGVHIDPALFDGVDHSAAHAGFFTKLSFHSREEAAQYARSRDSLDIADDDVLAVEGSQYDYVVEIVEAFHGTVVENPRGRLNNDNDKAAWQSFQATFVRKTNEKMRANPLLAELCAWDIFGNVVDIHKFGVSMPKTPNGVARVKCSERIAAAVAAIRDYGIVRYDIINDREHKLDGFVIAPDRYVTRKLTNWSNNQNKTRRDEENAAHAARQGVHYKRVLGKPTRTQPGSDSDHCGRVRRGRGTTPRGFKTAT